MRTMNFSLNNNCIKLVAIGIKLNLQKFVILRDLRDFKRL